MGATLANLPVAHSLLAAPVIACGNTFEAVNESLLLLLAFVSTVAVTGLVLTATLTERAK